MATNKVQDGTVIPWTNGGAAVSSGDVVVVGNLVGVALEDIAGSATGSVAIDSVWTVPKTAGTAWTQGAQLSYDVSLGEFNTPAALTEATGDVLLCGVAFVAAGSADTTGNVLINAPSSAVQ